jgi:hypothetical protein
MHDFAGTTFALVPAPLGVAQAADLTHPAFSGKQILPLNLLAPSAKTSVATGTLFCQYHLKYRWVLILRCIGSEKNFLPPVGNW